MGSAIVVENLVKKYGDFVAVNGISFEVRKGKIFGLLGPNGAGKTTTMHIIATILKPTHGRVVVLGHDVTAEPAEVRKRIGIVFQDPSLDLNLTAYENIYIRGKLYGLRGAELRHRIDELLKFVELDRFRNKVVRYFSGGMRRRLELACALIHEPEVLILDEPTIGLDPHSRARIWDYIKYLKRERGATIVIATHYMEEAEELCDRVAIIDRGRIVAMGSPDELKAMLSSDIVLVRCEKPVCIETPSVKSCRVLADGRVEFMVTNASRALPEIIESLNRLGVKILEVSYRRPTLNEVFLHITGRELRDSLEIPSLTALPRLRVRT